MNDEASRRKFLSGSATCVGTAALVTSLPGAAQAQSAAVNPASFTFFTPAQAMEIDAMAAQIMPTTDTPGAREAHAVYFIDMGLMTYFRDAQATYVRGFDELQAKVTEMFPGAKSFAALSSDQQIKLLTAIQDTAFFTAVRTHTMMGMFSAPQHGGNYNKVGWKLLGYDDTLNYKAPFGAYDV